jgi:hypothetical protein
MTTVIIIVVVVFVVGNMVALFLKRSPRARLPVAKPVVERKAFEIVALRNTSQSILSAPEPSPILTAETARRFKPLSVPVVARHCPECQTIGQVSQLSLGSWKCNCCGHHW